METGQVGEIKPKQTRGGAESQTWVREVPTKTSKHSSRMHTVRCSGRLL